MISVTSVSFVDMDQQITYEISGFFACEQIFFSLNDWSKKIVPKTKIADFIIQNRNTVQNNLDFLIWAYNLLYRSMISVTSVSFEDIDVIYTRKFLRFSGVSKFFFSWTIEVRK